ncbi:PRTRC system protein E [Mucilaginibacter sp. UYCu711]|uniref:PRTRC system protein E n=1 Tax=Mucilaginibacter sp. UYCu711 TaxID=3156339 RepID=UPI003D1D1D85
MDFFSQMLPLLDEGNLTVAFSSIDKETITVMVVMQPAIKDPNVKVLKPVVLTGKAQELDEEFFKRITEPVIRANGIISNIAEFEKATARLENENAQVKKEKEERKKKHDDFVKKADELLKNETDENINQAISLLTSALPFAENKDKLTDRISELKTKVSQTNLF